MSRRVSLPERALPSEDTGLEPVDNGGRVKSGSVSSDDGDSFGAKQGKFFKNLTRSLEPVAAPPKKKDFMEEYQKYKAKRAFNLHGVVKQQTIDLGTLGVSSSDKTAPSRRFSTGTNPPQTGQTSESTVKAATLPVSKGSRGPPPPVAPRKKSVNLPPIPEPKSPQGLPSPIHETPSYILSAVKKEQQRAELQRQRAASEPHEKSAAKEELHENNLSCSENKTPTELESKGEDTPVGVNLSESVDVQEAISEQVNQGDASYREEELLSTIQESADAEKQASDDELSAKKESELKEEEKVSEGGSTSVQNECSKESPASSETEGKELQQAACSEQHSESVESVEEVQEKNEVKKEANANAEVNSEEERPAVKEEISNEEAPATDTESSGGTANEVVKDQSCENSVPRDSEETVPQVNHEISTEKIENEAQESDNIRLDIEKVVDEEKNDALSGTMQPDGVVNGSPSADTSEVAKPDACQPNDSEEIVVMNGDSNDKSTVEKEKGSDNVATEKLSKTADLLLSFSQDKSKTVDTGDSDLTGIGEELKKLNSSIEELSQPKGVQESVSSEDQEKLKEIERMRQEMESMRQEMELFG